MTNLNGRSALMRRSRGFCLAAEVFFDVEVGFEGMVDVVVGGGEDECGVELGGEFPGVDGDDLCGDAIEVFEKSVGEDDLIPIPILVPRFCPSGQCECEFETVELSVGQFVRFSQEDERIGQAGD